MYAKIKFCLLPLDDLRVAKESAEDMLSQFNVFHQSAVEHPDEGEWWVYMKKIKQILVQVANNAKREGYIRVAEVYKSTYQKMKLPKKGKDFRKFPYNYD